MTVTNDPSIGLDRPLQVGTALKEDQLNRTPFARTAVAALRKTSASSGFVLSIEGAWGSGKTSTLAIIQELLERESPSAVVVHFNPWLVGDRDSLLSQFLAQLAAALSLTDSAEDAKKVAKAIRAYSKAFDVLKILPGAEPWTSMTQWVFEKVGIFSESVAVLKSKGLEQKKSQVQDALKKLERPVIVFVDDVDRLFPGEVFEMIRIVKAVGELPRVGYVLAWDQAYVTQALENAKIPQAETYLDKIVQARLTLPNLTLTAKLRLIDGALDSLAPEASEDYFPNHKERLSGLYFSGLREVLEQPRDIARVFNTVAMIEPALRGEVVLADIVGLSLLMVKALPVFQLLQRNPEWFAGQMPGNRRLEKSEDIVKLGNDARRDACARSAHPKAVGMVLRFLFPLVAFAEEQVAHGKVVRTEGHIADPVRLLIALQQTVSPGEVSLVLARRYLSEHSQRENAATFVSAESSFEFLEALGDLAGTQPQETTPKLEELCLSIAQFVDSRPVVQRSRQRDLSSRLRAEAIAERAIKNAIEAVDVHLGQSVAETIVQSGTAITVSADLLSLAYAKIRKQDSTLVLPEVEARKDEILSIYHHGVVACVLAGEFSKLCNPGLVLWTHSRVIPGKCRELFEAFQSVDSTLDFFATSFLSRTFDSVKGEAFSLPEDIQQLEAFVSLVDFQRHAFGRLNDGDVKNPVRAAWRSVTERKMLYAIDGSEGRL